MKNRLQPDNALKRSRKSVAKSQYIPRILSYLQNADLSKFKDSMRPLIEKDIAETEMVLKNHGS